MKKLLLESVAVALLAIWYMPISLMAQDVYHGGALDARQHGFEHGYRDGFSLGHNSQAGNRDQDIVKQWLRDADSDYHSALRYDEQYRQGYAEGFRDGMEESRSANRSRREG